MIKRIATLVTCLALTAAPVAASEGTAETRGQFPLVVMKRASETGPLLKAARDATGIHLRVEGRTGAQPKQDAGRQQRPWIQRHPVWAGALIGFGAGFGLTVIQPDNGIISKYAAGLVWGGVGAGVGALAGWGMSRDDDWDSSDNND